MKVSEIMDNYTDNEFLIEGQQEVSADMVSEGVLAKIKAEKKPLRLRTKILIIAAAVTALAGITGASLNDAYFTSQVGDEVSGLGGMSSIHGDMIAPYTIVENEDGKKVFFTANNEYIDITDYINRGENYYYYFSEVDNRCNEYPAILCVGGTIDDLGFGEYFIHADSNGSSRSAYNVGGPDDDKEWYIKFREKTEEFKREFIEKQEISTEEVLQAEISE